MGLLSHRRWVPQDVLNLRLFGAHRPLLRVVAEALDLSGPGSQSHRIVAGVVMLVIFLAMPVMFDVMLVIGSMVCDIVPG